MFWNGKCYAAFKLTDQDKEKLVQLKNTPASIRCPFANTMNRQETVQTCYQNETLVVQADIFLRLQ